jgi:hypothetical protein
MEGFIRINNTILQVSKIVYIKQDEAGDLNRVTVMFEGGLELQAVGAEAAELWRHFDPDSGWRNDD